MAGLMAVWTALQPARLQASSEPVALTTNEALSGIFGSISLASWIFVFVPQLYENYRQKSAAAVSILFIVIWFVGDATNFIGAVWAGLVPTIIAIGAYYLLADVIIASQCLYYNIRNAREERRVNAIAAETANAEATEDQPLLSRRDSSITTGLPGSLERRRRDSAARRSVGTQDSRLQGANGALTKIAEEDARRYQASVKMEVVKNTASILLICALGTAGWAICWKTGIWKPTAQPGQEDGGKKPVPIGAEIVGYISAFFYLAARIPQIIKNWREQSCEGLSLLFFLLSLLGNLAYGASILFHSLERQYVITNMPWLIGSLGTMVEDVTIFIQFRLYGEIPPATEQDSGAAVE